MSSGGIFAIRNRVPVTILATFGWPVLVLGWIIASWGHISFFQALAGVGIAALAFAAFTGVLWMGDQGFRLAASVVTALGGSGFVLYWLAFAWSRHTLLQNAAVLLLSLLVGGGVLVGIWLAGPRDDCC